MFVDYETSIQFWNTRARPSKNIWMLLNKFVQGKTNKAEQMNRLVVLRTWKKQINSTLDELKGLKITILKSFELYQSYIFHKFVKPRNDNIKNDDQYFAFITLMNDKWYYDQLKLMYLKANINSKKPKNKILVKLHQKESLLFNKEPRMVNESKFLFLSLI